MSIIIPLTNVNIICIVKILKNINIGDNDMNEEERLYEIGMGDVLQVVLAEELSSTEGLDVIQAIPIRDLPYMLESYVDHLKEMFDFDLDLTTTDSLGKASDFQTAKEYLEGTSFYY